MRSWKKKGAHNSTRLTVRAERWIGQWVSILVLLKLVIQRVEGQEWKLVLRGISDPNGFLESWISIYLRLFQASIELFALPLELRNVNGGTRTLNIFIEEGEDNS